MTIDPKFRYYDPDYNIVWHRYKTKDTEGNPYWKYVVRKDKNWGDTLRLKGQGYAL
tara:strand:+ start:845 stop:1012 length:168 start_codon:yes stop_codon:yes gene_type:complete